MCGLYPGGRHPDGPLGEGETVGDDLGLGVERNQGIDPDELILGVSPPVPGFVINSETFSRAFSYEPSGRVVAPDSQQHTGDFIFCAVGTDTSAQVVIVNPVGEPALSASRANGSTPDCNMP